MKKIKKFTKRQDLIDRMCGDVDARFLQRPCRQLEQQTRDCLLLKEAITSKFWEECRPVYQLIRNIIVAHLKQYRKSIESVTVHESDIKIENIIGRVTGKRLEKGHNLPVLYRYLKKTVHTEIRSHLDQEGLIPGKKRCGVCRHLSRNYPYVCALTGDQKNKTDVVCENYRRVTRRCVSLETLNDWGEKTGDVSSIDSAGSDPAKNAEEQLVEHSMVDAVKNMLSHLRQRTQESGIGTKKKKRYERQHSLVVSLLHYYKETEGASASAAIGQMAKQYHVNEKTIRRDLKEIRQHLKNKMSSSEWLDLL
jgi:hypothetical protein